VAYEKGETYLPTNAQLYHNSLSVQSTLLHVSTLSCHHHTVYSQYLAKLHKFCKLQLLIIQFVQLSCFCSSLHQFVQLSCFSSSLHQFVQLSCFSSSLHQLVQLSCFSSSLHQFVQLSCFSSSLHQFSDCIC
jgi:hypothetical protein